MNFKLEHLYINESICPSQMSKGEIGFITYHSSWGYIGKPVLRLTGLLVLLDGDGYWYDTYFNDMKVRLLRPSEVITLTGI